MAVAHDGATEFATFTTTSPVSDTHTPVADPQGVIVEIDHGGTSNDLITGVTYGGVAMERVAAAPYPAVPARVYLYFLGSGIPTGAQTVEITHTGTSDVKHATVATVTAAADTEIGGTGTVAAAIANPIIRLGRGPLSGLTYGVIYSQAADPGDLAPLASMSAISDHDYGATVSRFDRETTADDEAYTFGYTDATTLGNLIAAVSIQEQQTGCYPVGAQTIGGAANAAVSTTTFSFSMAGQLDGTDMYLHVVSRDHTAGTALPTATDDSGANTWDLLGNTSDRKALVWHKKGTPADVGATLTVAGCVGSTVGGLLFVKGGAAGDPTTNLAFEDNASGDETHAGFTPTNDGSVVVLGMFGQTGVGAYTVAQGATMGTLEPEYMERSSNGGGTCDIWWSARPLASGGTGTFTWARVNAASKSVAYAVAPSEEGFTGTGSSTLDDVTSDGDGTFTPPAITGTGASTLDDVTSAGSGTFTPAPITGTGSSTLGDVTSVGTGTYTPPGITGTGASTLEDVDSDGNGVFVAAITGTGASTLDDVTSVGVGSLAAAGQIGTVVCGSVAPVAVCGSVGPAASCSSTGPNATCRIE